MAGDDMARDDMGTMRDDGSDPGSDEEGAGVEITTDPDASTFEPEEDPQGD
jgi:hypothetical protein